MAAGGDVRISATGAGRDSDLTVRGGNISAGVGVAISLGSNGAAFGVTANASGGRGKGEGKDVTWSNTLVSAGEGLTLVSGGDTTLRGAVASDLPGFFTPTGFGV